MGCLSCIELEQKICDLTAQIEAFNCAKVEEGDTVIDRTQQLRSLTMALDTHVRLYETKCAKAGELYEFVQAGCTTPVTCVGASCRPSRRRRTY
jgi:hypothetical protein